MARLDPAVSRLKYRLERLMLTPLVRVVLRRVLPVAFVLGTIGGWASVEVNREAFRLMLEDLRAQIESRPEFAVRLMVIDGATPAVADRVRAAVPVEFPVSSFDLDLDDLRARIVALDAVRSADLRIRSGGILRVAVAERVPAVLWRHPGGLTLLDETGARVAEAKTRAAFARLPVIAGTGAEAAVPEALALYAAAGPLRDRLRGFERRGARRWDVVLDRGQRVLLPETGAVMAFERAIAMQELPSVTLLDRDVTAVDLRLPHRATIRMSAAAATEFKVFKDLEAGVEAEP